MDNILAQLLESITWCCLSGSVEINFHIQYLGVLHYQCSHLETCHANNVSDIPNDLKQASLIDDDEKQKIKNLAMNKNNLDSR